MIITRTPLRVSFIGGGTDLPAWYENHGEGQVFGATIGLYVYVIVSPHWNPHRYRVAYSRTEDVDNLDYVSHGIIRNALRRAGLTLGGVEIHTIADIPGQGSGLGSSAAVAVGTLKALFDYQKRYLHFQDLAAMAAAIEIEDLRTGAGKQDHYIAAYGGVNHFRFSNADPLVSGGGGYVDEKIRDHWSKWMPLFSTGIHRHAEPILKETGKRIKAGMATGALQRTLAMVEPMKLALLSGEMEAVGEMLDKAWKHKQAANPDAMPAGAVQMYRRALEAGALGGKLCGAGGGGYLLLVVPPRKWQAVADVVGQQPVRVPYGVGGSTTIFVEQR
ncbi:MAG TPA: hypothetical protein VIH05_08190 [Tepidiformaceae bacterium]